jgi:outer membrane translocation and assembly module TamA
MKPKTIQVKGFGFFLGLHLAGFADAGSAWTESSQFTKNFIGGGGFGIRLVVPFINIIRFDFGFGQSGKGMTNHFGIREKADYHRLRVR